MMKLAIMQPYFLPYIGYFNLLASVDKFILYDNIKYTKKGWFNRNRILMKGQDIIFSLPLKHGSDYLNVSHRELADDFRPDKMINLLSESYRLAPHYDQTIDLFEQIIHFKNRNLFSFLHHSITKCCEKLGINTEIKISSEVNIDHSLKGQEKVLELCRSCGADTYINPIGGLKLYSKDVFREKDINLKFIQAKPFEYTQFGHIFVPWLSIIDVMMFNSLDTIKASILSNFELI